MKQILFILCLITNLPCKAQLQAAFKEEKISQPVIWHANKPLKWIDFKRKPFDSNMAALSATELTLVTEIDETGIISFHVTALFNPDKSYVTNEALSNDFILRHEQMHFNIAELHAREIRKLILPFQNTKDVSKIELVNNIYDKLCLKQNEMQKTYDHETKHSIDKENQEKWNRLILGQLEKLNRYAEKETDSNFSKL